MAKELGSRKSSLASSDISQVSGGGESIATSELTDGKELENAQIAQAQSKLSPNFEARSQNVHNSSANYIPPSTATETKLPGNENHPKHDSSSLYSQGMPAPPAHPLTSLNLQALETKD